MACILPFRGISYNPHKIGDFGKVVAPPYDVISPQDQEALYQRHPWNVVRLILNKETPEDHPGDNRYTRSAALYSAWQKEEILVRAPQPRFYFLQEEFSSSILPAGTKRVAAGKNRAAGLYRPDPLGGIRGGRGFTPRKDPDETARRPAGADGRLPSEFQPDLFPLRG